MSGREDSSFLVGCCDTATDWTLSLFRDDDVFFWRVEVFFWRWVPYDMLLLLNRSLVFLRNGMRSYSRCILRVVLTLICRLFDMLFPSDVTSSSDVPLTQLYVAV